jgi:hypothetical protein
MMTDVMEVAERAYAKIDPLAEALHKLSNEVLALEFRELEIKKLIGATNYNLLMQRAVEARAELVRQGLPRNSTIKAALESNFDGAGEPAKDI